MIIRALDDNNDWQFGAGLSSYKKDDEAIKLNIKTRYNEWKGDCFFNSDAGIDWQNRLEVNQFNQLSTDIKSLILKSYGVTAILDLQTSVKNRVFKAEYVISTIFSNQISDIL